jgi:hypothetical protein
MQEVLEVQPGHCFAFASPPNVSQRLAPAAPCLVIRGAASVYHELQYLLIPKHVRDWWQRLPVAAVGLMNSSLTQKQVLRASRGGIPIHSRSGYVLTVSRVAVATGAVRHIVGGELPEDRHTNKILGRSRGDKNSTSSTNSLCPNFRKPNFFYNYWNSGRMQPDNRSIS